MDPIAPGQLDERELVERAKAGDPEAWKALYDGHKGYVFTVMVRIVRETSTAEDLAQDCWILIFKKIDQFEHRSPFKSWAAKVATNVALQHVRRRNPKHVELPEIPDRAPRLDDVVIDQAALESAIARMPPGYRAVLELRRAGFSYDEIAEAMEIQAVSARTQYHRALGFLHRIFTTGAPEGAEE